VTTVKTQRLTKIWSNSSTIADTNVAHERFRG